MKVAILSPHRDDAAFSCSYLILALMRAGIETTVFTIFTASDYAPFWPQRPHTDPVDPVSARRRDEDRAYFAALESLRPNAKSLPVARDLGWRDAPIRLGIDADTVCAADLAPAEVDALTGDLDILKDFDIVASPLALGGHLDHRLTRAAAERVVGADLAYYEDLPYAYYMTEAESRVDGRPAGLTAYDVHFTDLARLRRRFALCYDSQVEPAEAERLQAYAERHGGTERYYAPAAVGETLAHALSEFRPA